MSDADADTPYLSWLVTPSDDYSLHELKLHQSMIFPARDGEDQILPVMTSMLPDLRVLDVRWVGSALSVRDLIERCTSLEELHADLQVCKLNLTVPTIDLPQSLLHLHVLKSSRRSRLEGRCGPMTR